MPRSEKGFSLVIVLVVVLAILALVAVGFFLSKGKPAEKIVIGVKSAPLGFYGQDAVEYESPTFNFNSNIFEGLTTFTKDLKFASRQLVESWDNPSDTVWRLRLKKGVKFHNGYDFTAEDIKNPNQISKSYLY